MNWLQRAEAAGGNDDVAFVCLRITFNVAYAQDRDTERGMDKITHPFWDAQFLPSPSSNGEALVCKSTFGQRRGLETD